MKSLDNSNPSKYITYLDANNLYGGQWVNIDNSLDGHILEVDLEYPDELHELMTIIH